MSKAYLAWPVKLKDLDKELHVTLKYLGDSKFTLADLGRRFEGKTTILDLAPNVRWKPERFKKSWAHVMVLEGFDAALLTTRVAVADIRKDDYPEWRPHITMPPLLWAAVVRSKRTVQDLVHSVGPLTLYVEGQAVVTF